MRDDTVWVFWEGATVPYIELCAQTIAAHAPTLRRLDGSAFRELETGPTPDLSHLRLNHQADYVRASLLHTYGGLWLDADCVVFGDLGPYLDALRVCDYIGYREARYDDPQLGLMASRAGGRIISRHHAKLLDFLASGREPQWLELSSWPMNAALAEEGWQGYLQLDRRTVAPVPWSDNDAFFVERSDSEHAEHFEEGVTSYMLYNVMVPEWFKRLSADEILSGPTFLSYLFRRALDGGP